MSTEKTPSVFRVYFINFGYYSANETSNLDDAKKIAKTACFQSVIECDGTQVASYCPLRGFNSLIHWQAIRYNMILATYTKAGQTDVVFTDISKDPCFNGIDTIQLTQGKARAICTREAMVSLIAKMEALGFQKA